MADLINLARKERAARIAELNDALRTTFQGGRVLMTTGINKLSEGVRADVLEAVRTFSEFTGANDPHREHDFGAFEQNGVTVFWKVDYYAPDLQTLSEDPTSLEKTTRVLTIMRAEEY